MAMPATVYDYVSKGILKEGSLWSHHLGEKRRVDAKSALFNFAETRQPRPATPRIHVAEHAL